MDNSGRLWSSYHEDLSSKSGSPYRPQKYSSLDGRTRYLKERNGTSSRPYERGSSLPPSRHGIPLPVRSSPFLGVPRKATESLPGSRASSRSSTPFLAPPSGNRRSRTRSLSPRPMMESDAIETPGIQQEAFTRSFIYPSSFHRNLRLAGLFLVMAHVTYKTLGTWLLLPLWNKLSYEWTPRSITVNFPIPPKGQS